MHLVVTTLLYKEKRGACGVRAGRGAPSPKEVTCARCLKAMEKQPVR